MIVVITKINTGNINPNYDVLVLWNNETTKV